MNYAAELNDNICVRVIVGTADWATEHLGGVWVDIDDKAGPGWVWDGEALHPPEPDDIPEETPDTSEEDE